MSWDFSTDPDFQAQLDWMDEFVRREIWPLEAIWHELGLQGLSEAIAPLQEQVKERGLWATHLPPELGGQGMGQVRLGLMHEILGQSPYGPVVFGNNAPDSGNAELLAAGRVHLHRGDGTTIPASDGSLDAALAVHTLYFWPDPAATVTDIARALRADGRLVLAFRAGEHPTPARFDPDIYHLPTTTEVTQWLTDAGFKDVQIQNHADISHAVAWAIGFKR